MRAERTVFLASITVLKVTTNTKRGLACIPRTTLFTTVLNVGKS
jgi:hypothetical protein